MQDPVLVRLLDHFGERPFTVPLARTAGVSRGQVSRLTGAGELSTPLTGVYCCGRPDLTADRRAAAAALVLPDGGALARRTAAWLLGVDCRAPDERHSPMDVECVVPHHKVPIRRPGLRCFQAPLDDDDIDSFAGLPCTAPDRTGADLLRWLSPHLGLATVDALAGLGAVTADGIIERLERRPGDRFVRRARQLAWWIEPRSESFGESWLRLRLLEAGFPRPTAQIPVCDASGRVVYRLDLGWEERRIAIEYDGMEHHTSRSDRAHDRARRAHLSDEFQWFVLGVGMGEVLGPKLDLERGVGELLGLEPRIRRRTW